MSSNHQNGIRRIFDALLFSLAGLGAAYRNEAAFRQELWLIVVLAPVGLWAGETGLEKALLVGSLTLILIVELLNSAIEAAVDRIGAERHELSGRAKDLGSAAVLLTLLNAVVIWVLIFVT